MTIPPLEPAPTERTPFPERAASDGGGDDKHLQSINREQLPIDILATKKPDSPVEPVATNESASEGITPSLETIPNKSATSPEGDENCDVSGTTTPRPFTPGSSTPRSSPPSPPPVEPTKIHRLEMKGASTNTVPCFVVDHKAMKALTILFSGYRFNRTLYAPSVHKGALGWADFVYAMRTLGFAAEKLYGSAWVFVFNGDLWAPELIFHEPAPGLKVSNAEARQWGDKLWRAYGWGRASFLATME